MRRILNVVALDHVLVRQEGAVITDAPKKEIREKKGDLAASSPSLDGLEKGLSVFILLLDELGIIVEFVEGSRNGQQRRVGELEHGHNGLIKEIQGNVRGLIDDNDITTGTASGLKRRRKWTSQKARNARG